MTIVRHVVRAVGSTAPDVPAYRVELRTGRHRALADEPPGNGGGDAGPSPFGFLLMGLAACTATTLRMYAEHKGWVLSRIDVDVRYDDADDGRSVIERTVTVPVDTTAEQRERLAAVAERSPVTLAITDATPITTIVRSAAS
jgi:putative redox protein